MIKVLNIHWGFIPGGVAKYASLISNVSKIAPIEMKSICVKAPSWSFDQIAASKINMKHILISSRLDPSWIWKVRKSIRQEKPDLIFTYGFNGNFVAVVTNLGLDITIISSWHGKYVGTNSLQKIFSPFLNLLSNILLKYFVNHIVTVSGYSKNVLTKASIDPKKIKKIYNGIPPLPNFATHSTNIDNNTIHCYKDLLIGTVCRLDATKDLPTFLRAIRIVLNENNQITFIIWGDGPQKKFLVEMAKELKIYNNVKFMGYEPKIDQSFHSLDIFVLPSILENFSIALLEAMRSGLAIVSTYAGGIPEAVENNKHAILVPPGDSEALAHGILRFVDDRELRNKLGASAKKRFLEFFTTEKMIVKTSKWLINCAQTSKLKKMIQIS